MAEAIQMLIVDDDPTILTLLEEVFEKDPGLDVTALLDSEEAYNLLESRSFDLLITDLMMPKIDGLRLLEHAVSLHPEILVVIITGFASLETTLEAMHAGVYDYITKPFRIEEFRLLVQNAVERIRLQRENRRLARENQDLKARVGILGSSLARQQDELRRLQEELGRRQELLAQTATTPGGRREGAGGRRGLAGYEANPEALGARYESELRRLEELFSQGDLTAEEFDVARKHLRAEI